MRDYAGRARSLKRSLSSCLAHCSGERRSVFCIMESHIACPGCPPKEGSHSKAWEPASLSPQRDRKHLGKGLHCRATVL